MNINPFCAFCIIRANFRALHCIYRSIPGGRFARVDSLLGFPGDGESRVGKRMDLEVLHNSDYELLCSLCSKWGDCRE